MVQGDLQKSEALFDEAITLAKEKNLGYLENKVQEQKIAFEEQLATWQQLIARNASVSERIEFSKVEQYIKNAQSLVLGKMESTTPDN